jgi:predicted dehydrogenase
MFRWGVLSTAKIARQHVIPAILESENGRLEGIASRELSRAEGAARQFGARQAFGSYEELINSANIDGVYVALPSSEHAEWTLRAVNSGKHVLCEKPIATRAGDIDRLIEARAASGRTICEAFAIYYHPQWTKVRELIAEGAVGRIRHVQAGYSYFMTDPSNIRNQLELAGGALLDIGIYPMLATRMTTREEPRRVQATIVRDPDFGIDIYASVKADFGDFELSFYCSSRMALRQFMVFHGEQGFIEVHAPFNAGVYQHHRIELHNQSHESAKVYRFPDTRQYRLEVEAFVRATQGEDVSLLSLEDSRRNQSAIDAVFRAAAIDGWENV